MENFETNLSKAISICDGNFTYRHKFSSIYTFTTENISGYLKYFNLKDRSLLTVGSSGDQILNAYLKGARDITLYDINSYAKYYVYLKAAAVISLSYKEFQEFFFKHGLDKYYNKEMFSIKLFNKIKFILRLLDYESFLFFDELFSLYDAKKIREYLFDDDEARNKVIKSFNIYLRNEIVYNQLKSIMKKITFQYINGNIFEDNIDKKYDNVFLSNLCTTISIDKLIKLIEKLDKNNLERNGSMLLGYLWGIDFDENNYNNDWADIYKMPITRTELKKYITEHYNIRGSHNFIWDEKGKDDLVLIYRKKYK